MDITKALAGTAHFRRLSEELLGELARSFVRHDLGAGETLYQAGATVDALYVITHGTVVVFRGGGDTGAPPLARLRTGDVVGVADFFDSERRSETARTTEESGLLRGSRSSLLSFLKRQPQVELNLRLAAARDLTTRAKVSLAVAQRRVVRHRVNLEVQLTPAGEAASPATLIDLSTLGMSLRSAPDRWQLDDLVRYRLAWAGHQLDLGGRIAWRYGEQTGIELENPGPRLQEQLHQALERILASAA